jgi:hypothetical protein
MTFRFLVKNAVIREIGLQGTTFQTPHYCRISNFKLQYYLYIEFVCGWSDARNINAAIQSVSHYHVLSPQHTLEVGGEGVLWEGKRIIPISKMF